MSPLYEHLSISFYDTQSRREKPLEPIEPGKIRLYVCGPTVYDEAHLGHARCYITWDVLYRFLNFVGYDVTYVRNITDVEDKILKRAAEQGISPSELSQHYTERFNAVMAQLNVLPPNETPKATEFISEMITIIRTLEEKGFAYKTASGTVYFDTQHVSAETGYQYLFSQTEICHQSKDDLQSGARVDVDPEKRNPLDFALWKPAPADAPLVWDSPWGPGRPGWHIECSAMSRALLGEQIDIHAGGMDLIFPHHQNEIAQSEASSGKAPFVKHWMHNGFVNVSGEKMSKSLGNFQTVEELLKTYDANTIRHFLLSKKYRQPVDFSDEGLIGSKQTLRNIKTKIRAILKVLGQNYEIPSNEECLNSLFNIVSQLIENIFAYKQTVDFYEKQSSPRFFPIAPDPKNPLYKWIISMREDLNTAVAISSILEILQYSMGIVYSYAMSEFNFLGDTYSELKQSFEIILSLLSILGFNTESFLLNPNLELLLPHLREIYETYHNQLLVNEETSLYGPDSYIDEILRIRTIARENKNWQLSDQIRNSLNSLGIEIEDHKNLASTWIYEPVAAPAAP